MYTEADYIDKKCFLSKCELDHIPEYVFSELGAYPLYIIIDAIIGGFWSKIIVGIVTKLSCFISSFIQAKY